MSEIQDWHREAAEKIVPDCLSRTCFIKIGQDRCGGCEDSAKERARVATIIASTAPAQSGTKTLQQLGLEIREIIAANGWASSSCP